MTRGSYVRALDDALRPLGFDRNGDDWIRVRGDLWECVNRQAGQSGVTVNLYAKDLATEEVFLKIFESEGRVGMDPQYERIGGLIDGYDRWWKSDEAGGPIKLAEAVVNYGLPWFERGLTLPGQHEAWYGEMTGPGSGWYASNMMIGLALTLYRMGRGREACAVLGRPVPRMANPKGVAMVAKARDWMGCGTENLRAANTTRKGGRYRSKLPPAHKVIDLCVPRAGVFAFLTSARPRGSWSVDPERPAS